MTTKSPDTLPPFNVSLKRGVARSWAAERNRLPPVVGAIADRRPPGLRGAFDPHPDIGLLSPESRAFVNLLDALAVALDELFLALPSVIRESGRRKINRVMVRARIDAAALAGTVPFVKLYDENENGARPYDPKIFTNPPSSFTTNHDVMSAMALLEKRLKKATDLAKRAAHAWKALSCLEGPVFSLVVFYHAAQKGTRVHATLWGAAFSCTESGDSRAIDWGTAEGTRWRVIGFLLRLTVAFYPRARYVARDQSRDNTHWLVLSLDAVHVVTKMALSHNGIKTFFVRAPCARKAVMAHNALHWLLDHENDSWYNDTPTHVAAIDNRVVSFS